MVPRERADRATYFLFETDDDDDEEEEEEEMGVVEAGVDEQSKEAFVRSTIMFAAPSDPFFVTLVAPTSRLVCGTVLVSCIFAVLTSSFSDTRVVAAVSRSFGDAGDFEDGTKAAV